MNSPTIIAWTGLLLSVHLARGAVDSPVAADQAHLTFQVDAGLTIELVAAEPLTASPVAFAWDDGRRLYVVENRGYPTGLGDGTPGGVVVMLQDTDQDGRMDQRTVFAEGLTFPNGILGWDGGFFVTCAPDVFFLKDTNGDGRADVRQVVLTGFDTSATTQLRVAHPTLGPDGWIYLTSGLARAGQINSPLHPGRAPVKIGTDSRFNPFSYEIEPVDGRGQFGQTFDDWGNRFHCMNRVHIQHTVLPSRFLKRNPDLVFNETVQNVPEGMVDDLLKSKNVAARIYPISDNLTTADSHAGTFSAACSVHVYRGDGLPPDYYGDVLACDPTGNLVHRDRLTPKGPTFTSRMVREGREFLASRDNWFRPVFLATGPDGALYIADMYRLTVEHPDYLPEEVRKRTNFEAGRENGRIWRVRSQTDHARHEENKDSPASPADPTVKTDRSAPRDPFLEAVIEELGHPNVWQRERAFSRILSSRMSNGVDLLLSKLPSSGNPQKGGFFDKTSRKQTRVRQNLPAVKRINILNAAASLSGWNMGRKEKEQRLGPVPLELSDALFFRVVAATMDQSPGVRLAAFLLLNSPQTPVWNIPEEIIESWGEDPNPSVRFQVSLALGNRNDDASIAALARIGLRDGADQWSRAALLSGIQGKEDLVQEHMLGRPNTPPAPELAYAMGRYFGRKGPGAMLANKISSAKTTGGSDQVESWQLAFLAGVIESVGLRNLIPQGRPGKALFGLPLDYLHNMAQQSRQWIVSEDQPAVVVRSAAVVLAALGGEEARHLADLLKPSTAPDLVNQILGLLIEIGDVSTLERLISPGTWFSLSPVSRAFVIDTMLRRKESADFLLEAIVAERVQPTALSLAQRDRLKKRVSEGHRERAGHLFSSVGGEPMRVYEKLKGVAAMPGHAARGRLLFTQHCAACHRLDREGFNVGPDLFGVRNQTKEAILLHLLVPNQEVYADFAAVTIETEDDRSLTGIIRAENEHSLTLIQAQGLEETLSRKAIVSLQSGVVSLMPEGFDQVMTRQELADLLACLKGEP